MSNPKELMKLMVQITQNIKEHINNQHGLEIPAMWLPSKNQNQRQQSSQNSNSADGNVLGDDVNQINEVCAAIENSIHQKVQDNLSQVEDDCKLVIAHTKALLAKDEMEIAAKRSREIVAVFFAISAWLIPLVAFITLVVRPKVLMHCGESVGVVVTDLNVLTLACGEMALGGMRRVLASGCARGRARDVDGEHALQWIPAAALPRHDQARCVQFCIYCCGCCCCCDKWTLFVP